MKKNPPAFDVLGIGNAIVDVLATVDEPFLRAEKLAKGTMTLIDEAHAESLYVRMGAGTEESGGSVANSMAGIASLGGAAAYIGKVRDDPLGQAFRGAMRDIGVAFRTPPAEDGPTTARCLILVTPDAQRTMSTYLGACVGLTPDDLDAALIADATITYLEGYLWDPPAAKEAFLEAADIAHEAGRRVALTLSDPFCVERHRESFRDLVANHVDILFANEREILSLYQVETFDDALQRVRADCAVAALTRSEKGSVVLAGSEVHVIDPEPVAQVVDTTGAGDQYAAGFLFALARGRDYATCGHYGSIAAAEVISHVGGRPHARLRELLPDGHG